MLLVWQRILLLCAITSVALLPDRALSAQTATALDTSHVLASARPEIDAANAAWLPGLRKHDAQAIATEQ
jgi:hypothetical protein